MCLSIGLRKLVYTSFLDKHTS